MSALRAGVLQDCEPESLCWQKIPFQSLFRVVDGWRTYGCEIAHPIARVDSTHSF